MRGGVLFIILGSWLVGTAAAGELPTPPAGWKLEVVAAAPQVRHPSVVCCAPDGRVLVAEDPMDISLPSADAPKGRILCFHPDGRRTVFADQLFAVFGMQYLDGRLYVLHNPRFSVFDDAGDAGNNRRDLIRQTNPNPSALNWNDHVPANFRLAMDGYFYVAVGDKGLFNCVGTDGKRVDMRGGGILRLRPDGSQLEVFSTGVRNILDVAMTDEDDLFTYDNTDEHDWMGRLTHMVDGGFYGYPYDFVPRRPYTLWMMADYGAGAATGAFCYTEDALPADYRGNLFLADFGKRNILRVRIERAGATFRAVSREDLFTNVPADLRPVGIALSPDGATIYVCDWQHADTKEEVEVGRLLKLTYSSPAPTPKPPWYVPAATGKPFKASAGELVAALSHPSRDVRMVAQRRLAERNDSSGPLNRLMDDRTQPPLARAHALWALDSILGPQNDPLATITAGDASPVLRRQALRQLGMRRSASVTVMQNRLHDADASVRFHAATALGRSGVPQVVPALIESLKDPDGWVRCAAFTALGRVVRSRPEAVVEVARGLRSGDAAVRDGVRFALRDLYDRQLASLYEISRILNWPVEARAAVIETLAPLHHKPAEWKGEWWAYHPALGAPPRKTVEWEGTAEVLVAVRRALNDKDTMVRLAALDAVTESRDAEAAPLVRGMFAAAADRNVRRRALAALATCDDGESARYLMDYLRDLKPDDPFMVPLVQTLGLLKAVGAVPELAVLARRHRGALGAAAMDAIVHIGGEPAAAAVIDLLSDKSLDVRQFAARGAGELADRSTIPALLAAYKSPATRLDAIAALARMPDVRATDAYVEGLSSLDFAVRERCRSALREVRDAALPTVESVAKHGLSDDAVLELQQVYRDHDRAKSGPLFALKVTRKHPDEYVDFAVNHSGDAAHGAKLFAETTAGGVGCATCHAVSGHGGSVGPDLSGVGAKYSRRDLAESVVYPSKAVREGYQQVVVRTRNGQTFSGPVKAETPEELTLHEADGTLRRVRKSDIDRRKDTGLSPMPDGLCAGLSPQQFADLVSYLESLKTEAPTPGKERK